MNVFGKTLGLLLASLVLASCGGGGGNGGAFSPPVSSTISLSATSTTLPVNTAGYRPSQYGNPTQSTITIDWRNPNGSLVTGQDISVSISPPNIAALSCVLDGGVCTNADQLYASFTIKGTNGHATIFVNSYTTAGTAILTAVGVDPNTHANVSQSMTFTVTSGVGPAPASVTLVPSPAGVYLPSSGGTNTSVISATVLDGAGQLVPDPVSGNSGVDNIQFQIVGNAGDARLSSGSGSGTTVTSHTVHGVATVSFQAGDATPQGPVQIRATVDRADNNVSNGIQDPVTFTTSVVVSDGKLDAITLSSPIVAPNLPSVTINCITSPCAPVSGSVTPGATAIPSNPDGTLTLAVSAKGVDRQGSPVLPGTTIRFGLIDSPVGAPGSVSDNQFLISGPDGNPQEAGTLFTAPSGHFTTAGGGAGPGDALVVFGKLVQGNEDLESAVTVQTVTSPTSMVVAPAFNTNDYSTGVSVDYGSVLPYLVGRAAQGSITAQAATDANGVAHASVNYTVRNVGDAFAMWAQGSGVDRVTNGARQVTDAGIATYPGVAPATLVVTPLSISGNSTQNVTVCVTDALGISLRGVSVGFSYAFTGAGNGSVDLTPNSGSFAHLTGVNGCTVGVATTSNIAGSTTAGTSAGTLTVSAAGQTQAVTITAPAIKTLTVNVNAAAGDPAGSYAVAINSSAFSPPGQGSTCVAAVVAAVPPATTAAATKTCTFTFNMGATVSLSESGPGTFTGWTGDCANGISASTTVTMSGDKSCTATW